MTSDPRKDGSALAKGYAAASTNPSDILLPLVEPLSDAPHAREPPLYNLPNGKLIGERLAFKVGETEWIASSHTCPAAYPRTHLQATCPPGKPIKPPEPLPQDALQSPAAEKAFDKAKRSKDAAFWKSDMTVLEDIQSYSPPSSKEEAEGRARQGVQRKDPLLWNVIERIAPRQSSTGHNGKGIGKEPVTLFLAHATGFHKEIYEPFVKHLLERVSKYQESNIEIEEVWSIDTIISGEAAALNRGSFGEAVHWVDSARDIAHFLQTYLPETAATASQTLSRTTSSKRRIIGLGHSYAGAAIALAANAYPSLFEKIILLDPILTDPEEVFHNIPGLGIPAGVQNIEARPTFKEHPLAMGAALRKETWRSWEAAAESFRSKPFFQAWDKEVLDNHLRYGITLLPDEKKASGQVTLTMPKWLEASSFTASWLSTFAARSIASGSFSRYYAKDSRKGKTHIMAMSESFRVGHLQLFGKIIGQGGQKFKGSVDVMPGAHLAAQEQPAELAKWVLAYLLDRPPPIAQPKSHL